MRQRMMVMNVRMGIDLCLIVHLLFKETQAVARGAVASVNVRMAVHAGPAYQLVALAAPLETVRLGIRYAWME
jgi:hypothetical protein